MSDRQLVQFIVTAVDAQTRDATAKLTLQLPSGAADLRGGPGWF